MLLRLFTVFCLVGSACSSNADPVVSQDSRALFLTFPGAQWITTVRGDAEVYALQPLRPFRSGVSSVGYYSLPRKLRGLLELSYEGDEPDTVWANVDIDPFDRYPLSGEREQTVIPIFAYFEDATEVGVYWAQFSLNASHFVRLNAKPELNPNYQPLADRYLLKGHAQKCPVVGFHKGRLTRLRATHAGEELNWHTQTADMNYAKRMLEEALDDGVAPEDLPSAYSEYVQISMSANTLEWIAAPCVRKHVNSELDAEVASILDRVRQQTVQMPADFVQEWMLHVPGGWPSDRWSTAAISLEEITSILVYLAHQSVLPSAFLPAYYSSDERLFWEYPRPQGWLGPQESDADSGRQDRKAKIARFVFSSMHQDVGLMSDFAGMNEETILAHIESNFGDWQSSDFRDQVDIFMDRALKVSTVSEEEAFSMAADLAFAFAREVSVYKAPTGVEWQWGFFASADRHSGGTGGVGTLIGHTHPGSMFGDRIFVMRGLSTGLQWSRSLGTRVVMESAQRSDVRALHVEELDNQAIISPYSKDDNSVDYVRHHIPWSSKVPLWTMFGVVQDVPLPPPLSFYPEDDGIPDLPDDGDDDYYDENDDDDGWN